MELPSLLTVWGLVDPAGWIPMRATMASSGGPGVDRIRSTRGMMQHRGLGRPGRYQAAGVGADPCPARAAPGGRAALRDAVYNCTPARVSAG
jgi:hypothetical protein